MKRLLFIFCALWCIAIHGQEMVDLSGLWECSVGDSLNYKDFVELPGVYQNQGETWYKKSVYIPQSWKNLRVTIFLERPYHETTIFVNGEKVMRQMSLWTPHQCDVTRWLKPGQRNTIVVCVSNGSEKLNGIAGRMELRAQLKELYIEKVRIRPDLSNGCVHLSLDAGGPFSWDRFQDYNNFYTIAVVKDGDDPSKAIVRHRYVTEPHIDYDFHFIDSVYLWDEFHPNLYRIGISLANDYYETTFGMYDIAAYDRQLYINEHPMILRGTVENHFPLDSVCPMHEDEWETIFSQYKEYGLNHVRFQSYCPPEVAFHVADRFGLYLQVELPSGSVEESKRIIDTYGHHPSFVMVSSKVKSNSDWEQTMKKYDPKKIYDLELPMIASGESYKQSIEENLRTEDCMGFLLQSFDDVSKKMPATDWVEFCSPVVVLAKFPKTIYSNKDTLVVPVEVCNAMYGSLMNVRQSYYLTDAEQHVLAGGLLSSGDIPTGKNINIGTVSFPLDKISEPAKLTLTVSIGGQFKNHWDFWVRPEEE